MLNWLAQELHGRLSMPGDERYAVATAIWAKPIGRMPRAVVHCQAPEDVQLAIRAGRDCEIPISVRGGGHDWAGRALCEGIVIDLSAMNAVAICPDKSAARLSGGARAADIVALTDPLGLALKTCAPSPPRKFGQVSADECRTAFGNCRGGNPWRRQSYGSQDHTTC